MTETAFDTYLAGWRDASPQRALAYRFLRPDEQRRFGALGALTREWQTALHDVREPRVAMIKLGWWREELQRAADGAPGHPLTEVLFAHASMRAVPLARWVAPVDAAALALNGSPASDFAAQRIGAEPLAQALGRLETAAWFGVDADATRAAAVTLLDGLVTRLRVLDADAERGRSPLPMNLLARHGLSVEALLHDSPARRRAVHDQVASLRQALTVAATMAGPLSVFRAADLQHDLATLARSERADNPLPPLHAPASGFGTVLKTWRAARIWRGMSHNAANP